MKHETKKIIVAIIVTAFITMTFSIIGMLVIKETLNYSIEIKKYETKISELKEREEELIESQGYLYNEIDTLSNYKHQLFSEIWEQTDERLEAAQSNLKRLSEEIEQLTIIRDALKEDIKNIIFESDIVSDINITISM